MWQNLSVTIKRRFKINISFFGHRDLFISKDVYAATKNVICDYIDKDANRFLFGGYGRFDDCCYKITKELVRQNVNIHTVFVTPYINFSSALRQFGVHENNLYDEIIYPPIETVPLKFVIAKRNEYIVNNSDVVIV